MQDVQGDARSGLAFERDNDRAVEGTKKSKGGGCLAVGQVRELDRTL